MVELLAAMFIGGMIVAVTFSLFANFRRAGERPRAMTGMEESSLGILHRLERDLAETNLQSIRSTAGGTVACISDRDDEDHLLMSGFGTVRWTRFVYYQLQPGHGLTYDDSTSGIGPEPVGPLAATIPPGPHHRVVAPNATDFRVYWLDGSSQKQDFQDGATQRGEPVVVDLTLSDVSESTGRQTVRHISLRVKPQN